MKLLSDDLRKVLAQDPSKIRKITEKLVDMAQEGDLSAIQMVFDRLEGKPHQTVEIDQTVSSLPREERLARLLEMQAMVLKDVTPPAPVPVKQIPASNKNGDSVN